MLDGLDCEAKKFRLDSLGSAEVLNASLQELPGSPVVKTPCFHCKGCGFDPWLGKNLHAMWCGQKKKKNQTVPTRETQDEASVPNENSTSGVACGLEGKRWRQGDHLGKCCLRHSCLGNPQLTLAK